VWRGTYRWVARKDVVVTRDFGTFYATPFKIQEFTSHTKVIAFTDDLAILTYGKTTSKAEAYANADLARIENWAKRE
jgi:hypothetical protein